MRGVSRREICLPFVILCLDDDPTGLFVRRLLLSNAGYKVMTATRIEAALAFFKGNHVDLVITDYFLADGNGAEFACQLKRLKPAVPVVLLTAWMEVPAYDDADMLLSKGMTPEEFLREIAILLSSGSVEIRHSAHRSVSVA